MRFLPTGSTAFVVTNERQYVKHSAEWSQLPLEVRAYSTSQQKTPYQAAQEVFLAAVRDAAADAARGEFSEDWFVLLDDDTFVDVAAVQRMLSRFSPDSNVILAKHYRQHYKGGPGIYFTRNSLLHIDASCLDICDPLMKWSDVALAAMLGTNKNIIDWRNLESSNKHYCGTDCIRNLGSRHDSKQSTWRPSGFKGKIRHGC